MKRFKLFCSAIAALTVLALAGCDLEVPDSEKADYIVSEYEIEKLPYSADGVVTIGSIVQPLTDVKKSDGSAWTIADGLSLSFAIGSLSSDWTQIFHTDSGNIGLTCMHYCKDGVWTANIWPDGYPTENSPAEKYDIYLNTDCYVTISITEKDITFYKDGEKMFHYADSGSDKVGYAADTAFPGMESWCKGILQSFIDSGCEFRSKDTWTTDITYKMNNFNLDVAVDASGAKTKYDAYKAAQ